MRLTAADVMTRGVLAVGMDWSVADLAEFLAANAISGAAVVDASGRVRGVVSLTDIARPDRRPEAAGAPPHEYYAGAPAAAPRAGSSDAPAVSPRNGRKVEDIMTAVVFEVDETAPVQEVAEVMLRGHVHRMFVTRNGEVTGVVTALDLVRIVAGLPTD